MPASKPPKPSAPYYDLAVKLRDLLASKHLHDVELSRITNKSRSMASKWTRGEFPPDPFDLRDIAAFFEVDYDELLVLARHVVPGDRPPMLPGWDEIAEEDRAAVRRLVAHFARMRRPSSGGREAGGSAAL